MIDDALDKIESGEYGTCDHCGAQINPERLEVMPHSTFCLDCKDELESAPVIKERPIEEEALRKQPGGEFNITDLTDNAGYDGEDSWQDAAKVGTSNTFSDELKDDGSSEITEE
jgi:hypothetical protein